jgi:hypothetical protein
MWDAYREETQPEILDALPVSAFQTKPRSRVGSLFSAEHEQLPAATLEQVKQQSGAVLGAVTAALQLTYAVTRFKVRLTAVVCRVHQSPRSLPDGWSWHAQEDLGELPLSKTGRQITDWLQQFGN